MSRHYHNEHDPYAAQWIRNLIDAGELPPGDVDTRSIKDVTANDLRGYVQCHFFAGIAGWSLALKLAGWPDDRPVWTASLPCQPFSPAGKQKGKTDERHLLPVFLRLFEVVRPRCCFGEQVASAVRHGWLDDLFDGMESIDYPVWAVDLPACSIGSPTIRQRIFWGAGWVSEPNTKRHDWRKDPAEPHEPEQHHEAKADHEHYSTGGLSGTDRQRRGEAGDCHGIKIDGGRGAVGGLLLPGLTGLEGHAGDGNRSDEPGWQCAETNRPASPASRFSADTCDWLSFLDGKTRPIEPSLKCLVDGPPFRLADGRTGRQTQSRAVILKGIGNAIVPSVAAAFIKACCESRMKP